MSRDPRFAELDALIANDPTLKRWRAEDATRAACMKPRLLRCYILPVLPRPRRIQAAPPAWKARRFQYLAETGRMEASYGAC